MRPINVLRVITWLPVGGIERRLVAVLPRLDHERFSVTLACTRELGPLAEQLQAAGVAVELIPFRYRWDLRAMRELAALMRRRRIDIVHSHMYRANLPATVAARLAGVPHVWSQVHNVGTWETRRQAWMDRFLCRWRDGMIAVSERVRRDVIRRLHLPPERVKVIYNGVDMNQFSAAREKRAELRRARGVNERETVFLFAARLVEQKCCGDFLAAFGRLQIRPGGANLRAWVLGDGPQAESLKKQAAEFADSGAVTFFGMREDVADFLAAADVFVLPSIREGFSNALVEAMATGLAIVATDVGGNSEAIRDGRDGLIVPPRDAQRLEDAMAQLWQNPDLRRSLAESAATHAELFSLDRMVRNVEELYLETMRNPRRQA